jgi:hypothetical protein
VFLSVADDDKRAVILPAHRLQELGFRLIATEGTAEILARNGIRVDVVSKYPRRRSPGAQRRRPHQRGRDRHRREHPLGGIARADGYEIRAAAVAADKALFTTMAVLGAAVSALPVLREGFSVRSLQEYAPIARRPAGERRPGLRRAGCAPPRRARTAVRRDRPARGALRAWGWCRHPASASSACARSTPPRGGSAS